MSVEAIDDIWNSQDMNRLSLDEAGLQRLLAVRRGLRSRWVRLGLELLLDGACVAFLLYFVVLERGTAHIAATGVAMLALWMAMCAPAVQEFRYLWRLDFDTPVAHLMATMEQVRLYRLRMVRWILLLSPLLWPIGLVVGIRALTGLDGYLVLPPSWLAANVVFGLLWIPVVAWIAPWLLRRLGGASALAWVTNTAQGVEIDEAMAFLASLESRPG